MVVVRKPVAPLAKGASKAVAGRVSPGAGCRLLVQKVAPGEGVVRVFRDHPGVASVFTTGVSMVGRLFHWAPRGSPDSSTRCPPTGSPSTATALIRIVRTGVDHPDQELIGRPGSRWVRTDGRR